MTWSALSAEVAVMFGELSNADEYEAQVTIEWWVRERLRATGEASKLWSRRRYAEDIEYRTRKIQQVKDNHRRKMADPDKRAAHRAYMREYMRRRYQQQRQQAA